MKSSDKRDGSGAYNWGTPITDDLAAGEEQGTACPPKDIEENAVDVDINPDAEVLCDENKENVEEVAEVITFEEWKLKEQQSRSKPEYNIRQANEGEKIKGLKELKKKQTEEEKEEDGSLYFPKRYYEEKYKTSGREKVHMDLHFQYNAGDNRHFDSERGRRGGRGGRGRGRGRGGGDPPARRECDESPVGESGVSSNEYGTFKSTPTTDEAEIQLEDDQEFPTLA